MTLYFICIILLPTLFHGMYYSSQFLNKELSKSEKSFLKVNGVKLGGPKSVSLTRKFIVMKVFEVKKQKHSILREKALKFLHFL